ncbi:MAG TPA: DsbA family oxidoreductase [Burkholderiales bacterium]|jgi:predicted DsbA family dithiol-disulfide isomerase
MSEPLTIDVISDVVCPWCFIGKRRLEAALKLYAEKHPDAPAPQVTWHPFQLNPGLPPEGMSRQDYVTQKFGPGGAQKYERVKEVGKSVGLDLQFDKIVRQPNTLAAHSLIGMATPGPAQDQVKETLLNAYFIDTLDLTDEKVLLDLAEKAGLDRAAAEQNLHDPRVREQISGEDEQARRMGVEGVPFFIFNKRLGLSGAHEPETILDAIEQAATAEA